MRNCGKLSEMVALKFPDSCILRDTIGKKTINESLSVR